MMASNLSASLIFTKEEKLGRLQGPSKKKGRINFSLWERGHFPSVYLTIQHYKGNPEILIYVQHFAKLCNTQERIFVRHNKLFPMEVS